MTREELAALLLRQVETSVARFVTLQPGFRSEADDLTQDAILRCLTVIESTDLSQLTEDDDLRPLRGYVHVATRSVIADAMGRSHREKINQEKLLRNADFSVYYSRPDSQPAIEWERVEAFVARSGGLLEWYESELNPEVREALEQKTLEFFDV